MKSRLQCILCFCAILIISQRPAARQATFWWNNAVFYEIFVRSFYDASGDGIGDLQGVLQKLDYLKTLGVDAVWLMPIMPAASYHGYDVTDYYDVNPDYGTRAAFRQLADSAHHKGIKIIIDYVMNHTSDRHPWFISSSSSSSSQYRSWYVWQQSDPGFIGPWGQQVWYPLNGSYYYGIFWSGMPDLNYRDTAVQNKMLDIAGYWLDSMHVDGFRLDAIQYLVENNDTLFGTFGTHQFLSRFRNFYSLHNPQAFTVGEVTAATAQAVPYVGPAQLNSCFEFDLAAAMIAGVNAKNPDAVRTKIAEVTASYPFLQYATFLSNHDQDRVSDQVKNNPGRMRLSAGLLLTLPGIPFLYYGEEIGMTGSGADPARRTPMQWTNAGNAGFSATGASPWEGVNNNFGSCNVQSLRNDSNSLWHWYEKLIAARHGCESLRIGAYAAVQTGRASIFAFSRYTDNQLVLAFHNFDSVTAAVAAVSLQSSFLGAGDYQPVNFLAPQETVNALTLNAAGGFTNYNPGIALAPYGTAIIVVYKQTRVLLHGSETPQRSVRIQTAQKKMTIECMIPSDERWTVEIVDLQGRMAGRAAAPAGHHFLSIDKTAWHAGMYIVSIVKGGKVIEMKKIAE